jgi:hypothetical protein
MPGFERMAQDAGICGALRARLLGDRILVSLQLGDQAPKRAQVHLLERVIRSHPSKRVGQQVFGFVEQVDIFLAGGELHLVCARQSLGEENANVDQG